MFLFIDRSFIFLQKYKKIIIIPYYICKKVFIPGRKIGIEGRCWHKDKHSKDPVLTKTEKQQAYVKESLTRAMQEVRMAKLNGQKLPDARDLLKELDEED